MHAKCWLTGFSQCAGGHDVWDPTTCNRAFACVTGEAQYQQESPRPHQEVSSSVAASSQITDGAEQPSSHVQESGQQAEAARLERSLKLAQTSTVETCPNLDMKSQSHQEGAEATDNSELVTPMPATVELAEATALAAARQASMNVFQAQLSTQLMCPFSLKSTGLLKIQNGINFGTSIIHCTI